MSDERHETLPAAPEQDHLLDHNYDGIQEYDNPMPRWWVAIFWATIVFSVFYVIFYHGGPGKLAIEAYNEDMVAYYDLQAQQFLALGEITEDTLHGLMDNEAMMAGAQQVFVSRCAQCHGTNAEGNIGPNLTDQYWLHGNQLTDIYRTIMEGVVDKGMQSWRNVLRPAEIMSLAAYVGTLRGTEPPNPKAPQGEEMPYTFEPSEEGPEPSDTEGDDRAAAASGQT